MDHPSQHAPYDDIPTSHDFRARIDIAQYNDIAGMMNGLARTDCAPQKEGIICFPQVTLSLQGLAQCDCIWSRNARRCCLRLSMCLLLRRGDLF